MAGVNPGQRQTRAKWRLPTGAAARLGWEARRAWLHIGPVAMAGMAFAALAIFLLWNAHALRQYQSALAEKIAQRQDAGIRPAPDERQEGLERRLAAFHGSLPGHELIPDQLRRLIDLAEKNGVALHQAEYKPQSDNDAGFMRYQMIFPLKADYPKVQAFILSSMEELPTLILESVSFKRDRIDSSEVEARIQYVLLVRKPDTRGVPQ